MRGCPLPLISALQPPTDDIIRLLTEFATASRYHNLDSVAGSIQTTDPLDRWNSILLHVIQNDLSASLRKKVEAEAKHFADILDGKYMVRMNSLDGKGLTLFEALLQHPLHKRAVPYVVRYIILFLAPIRDYSGHLHMCTIAAGVHVPELTEFLDWIPRDEKGLLRKKQWP